MDYQKTADQIIEKCGGKENILDATHCFTRIRFNLKENEKASVEEVKKIPDVMSVQIKGGQFQVIIGTQVEDVYNAVMKKLDTGPVQKKAMKLTPAGIFGRFLDMMSNVFAPVIPAIIGAGVVKGVLALLVAVGLLSDTSGVYTVLYAISDAAFYFLPFFLAVTSSNRFGMPWVYGVTLAGVLLYPSILGATEPISFFGLQIPVVGYSSSIIPIILSTFVTSYIYRFFDRYVPKVLRLIITPVATMFVAVPLMLLVTGPLGYNTGSMMSVVSTTLFTKVPWLAGLIIGGLYPFIIMTGMHLAYFPVMIQNIAELGFDTGFLQVGLFSNLATAGSTLGASLRTKNPETRSVAISAAIAAALGTTEPAIYGIETKFKTPLYATMISSALVSAVALQIGVRCYGLVSPGLLALTVYIGPEGIAADFLVAVVGALAAFVIGFVLSFALGIRESDQA